VEADGRGSAVCHIRRQQHTTRSYLLAISVFSSSRLEWNAIRNSQHDALEEPRPGSCEILLALHVHIRPSFSRLPWSNLPLANWLAELSRPIRLRRASPTFYVPVDLAFLAIHLKGNGPFPNALDSSDLISMGRELRRSPF
jgi:hypothetical protein